MYCCLHYYSLFQVMMIRLIIQINMTYKWTRYIHPLYPYEWESKRKINITLDVQLAFLHLVYT